MKLNNEELARITLDYQERFIDVLDDLKRDISHLKKNRSGLKSDFSKLTTDIQVTRNVNIKLSERLVTKERRCYANVQYFMRECPELSGIPASISDNSLESNVLEILEEEIDVPIYSSFVEDCHCLPFKGSPKKFLKRNLSKRHLKFVGIEIRNLLIR